MCGPRFLEYIYKNSWGNKRCPHCGQIRRPCSRETKFVELCISKKFFSAPNMFEIYNCVFQTAATISKPMHDELIMCLIGGSIPHSHEWRPSDPLSFSHHPLLHLFQFKNICQKKIWQMHCNCALTDSLLTTIENIFSIGIFTASS